jgi:hypothetical protein
MTSPIHSLGSWTLRQTAILRKERKRPARVLLLFPPAGFTGRARLGVIDDRGRTEYTAAWHGGRSHARSDPLASSLDAFFGDLLPAVPPADSAARAPDDATAALAPRWPAVFAAAQDAGPSPKATRIDLLLEMEPQDSPGSEDLAPLSGSLMLPPLQVEAILYLAAILPDPERAGAAAELLAGALDALAGDRALRLAAAESWAATIQSSGSGTRAAKLAAAGRFELLRCSRLPPAEVARLGLPWPTRIGMFRRGATMAESGDPIRGVLLLPGGDGAGCGGLEAGELGRMAVPAGDLLLYALPPTPAANPLEKEMTPFAAALFDRLVTRAAARVVPQLRAPDRRAGPDRTAGGSRATVAAGEPVPTAVRGLHALFLEHAEDWDALGSAVRRWNREHISPRILPATPSDYFSAVAGLHDRGALRLARI